MRDITSAPATPEDVNRLLDMPFVTSEIGRIRGPITEAKIEAAVRRGFEKWQALAKEIIEGKTPRAKACADLCYAQVEKLTAMNKAQEEAVSEARVLGAKAFHSGIKSAPALDPAFMKLLKKYLALEPKTRTSLPLYDAWSSAWHAENLKPGEN